MGKILVIAEKPSVARDIARVLNCRQKGDGFFAGDPYLVSWALGHLVTLAEPQAYDPALKKWRADALPILPETMRLAAVTKTRSQLKVLKALLKDPEVDSLVCATDSGREGELIFRYIYQFADCHKPFARLWISSMTDAAIQAGFADLRPGAAYDDLYRSARCRAEADWLVGINATRAYSLSYDALLSIGRVQTPTLAMLVDRQAAIDVFVPEDYFQVQADFGAYTGLWWDVAAGSDRFAQKDAAVAAADRVRGKTGIVAEVTGKEKQEPPPLLYDLTELQRDCNRVYGFSAQKTLTLAQSLYETHKRITYPRTDSRYITSDLIPRLPLLLRRVAAHPDYAAFAAPLLALTSLPITKRIADDTKVSDHHALLPTEGPCRTEGMTEDERKVYDLVLRRFLAVFYPPRRTRTTQVLTRVETDVFRTTGVALLEAGWAAVYAGLPGKRKKEEAPLPSLQTGDAFPVKKAQVLEKKTTPPSPYTEATLLSGMENAGRLIEDEALKEQMKAGGLGTPATRAAIIERLIRVGYVTRKGKNLLPTEKAKSLIALVPPELKSPETTGKWERGLAAMAQGKMDPERFMGSIRRYVQYLVGDSRNRRAGISFPTEKSRGRRKTVSLGACPACGEGEVLENSKSYYCSRWKSGCSFQIWKDSLDRFGAKLDDSLIRTLLKTGKVEGLSTTLPQTGETGTATLVLRPDFRGVELRDRQAGVRPE